MEHSESGYNNASHMYSKYDVTVLPQDLEQQIQAQQAQVQNAIQNKNLESFVQSMPLIVQPLQA